MKPVDKLVKCPRCGRKGMNMEDELGKDNETILAVTGTCIFCKLVKRYEVIPDFYWQRPGSMRMFAE